MSTLVLHHSAGNQDRPARDDWETGNRWYNWIIDGAGVLHHFKNNPNQRSCGKTYDLAFSGNFVNVDPTPAQVATWEKFRNTHDFDTITTHGQLAKDKPGCATASACPGRLLQFISLKPNPMPTDKLSDHIVDGMPADQRIAALKQQVREYKGFIEERDNIINHPDEGIGALKSKIEELKKQIEQGGDNAEAAQQLAKAKAAYQALGEALT